MTELPPGHDWMEEAPPELAKVLTAKGAPEKFSLNMFHGPPVLPARIVHCLLCNASVYRSLKADDALPAVCYDCMEEARVEAAHD